MRTIAIELEDVYDGILTYCATGVRMENGKVVEYVASGTYKIIDGTSLKMGEGHKIIQEAENNG